METEKTIVMKPIEEWRVATIIKFKFTHCLYDCPGTIVYKRPYTNLSTEQDYDSLDKCIIQTIEKHYSNVRTYRQTLAWENSDEELQAIHNGGRPKINIAIYIIPNIDDQILQSGQQFFNAYKIPLSVYLDYIGDCQHIISNIVLSQCFQYSEDAFFKTHIPLIKTL